MNNLPSGFAIQLQQVGKKFKLEWIFKNIDYKFTIGNQYAILGPNGSGKSTLLQLIAAALTPSKGEVNFFMEEEAVAAEEVYRYLSWSAPYLNVPENFTLKELIEFHTRFKSLPADLNNKPDYIAQLIQLGDALHKPIQYFSSGMKQRAKLGLAILSHAPVLLLDEPTTNLDTKGIDWYYQLIEQYAQQKLLIIASNQTHEYRFCKQFLNISDYK